MEPISKGNRLGEYVGELRRYDLWCNEIQDRKRGARGSESASPFIREELYAAWAGAGPNSAGVVADAYAFGNAMRFINCSCRPNVTFRSFGKGAQDHYRLEVVVTRDIEKWEQLSTDYGWYYDDATLSEIRGQAVLAYGRDLPALQRLHELLPAPGQGLTADTLGEASEAVATLREAVLEARGPPGPPRSAPASFVRRFVDPEQLAVFLERGGTFGEAADYLAIPEPVWSLYEVVGAEMVGVPCRCALDRSLNPTGRCSGIIGRPLQATFSGRGEPTQMQS